MQINYRGHNVLSISSCLNRTGALNGNKIRIRRNKRNLCPESVWIAQTSLQSLFKNSTVAASWMRKIEKKNIVLLL